MSSSEEARLGYLVEGLEKLRTASILFIVSTLLAGVGSILILPALFSSAMMIKGVATAVATATTIFVLIIIAAIIALIALFAFLIPSFSKLRDYDESAFGIPHKLVKIGYVIGFILLILGPLIMISAIFAKSEGLLFGGIALLIIAGILLLIGQIGVIVGMFRLNDRLKETLFLVAGILFIVGIFISLASFIAWILVLIAAGSAIDKLRAKSVTPTG